MRTLVPFLALALTVSSARADPLSAADREALLENLQRLRDAAGAKVDARFRLAIGRYRSAMSSDKAALAFYLECIELVNFKEQKKKTSEFLAWKSQESDKHGEAGFRLALQFQLNWLVLTLQASSEKADIPALAADAQSLVDTIFRSAERLAGQEQVLYQGVTSTIFAKAYDIGNLENDKWPLSPVQLDEFYGKLIFPPLRTPSRVDSLRAAWIRRIQQESIKVEFWGRGRGNNPGNNVRGRGDKPDRRIGMASDAKSPEFERFLIETLPELQWQMECDLFRCGDESGAAVRMFAHLEKHLNHRSARSWSDQFVNLLKPPAPPAPPPPTPVE